MSLIVDGTLSAVEYDCISLAECRSFLRLPTSATGMNAAIELIRPGVLQFFRDELGGVVESRYCVDEKYNITDAFQDRILTRYAPIVGNVTLTDNGTLIASTAYQVLKEAGVIIYKNMYFTADYGAVEITYQCGYTEANLPANLKLGMLMLVKTIYDEDYANKSSLREKVGRHTIESKVNELGISTLIERLLQKRRYIGL